MWAAPEVIDRHPQLYGQLLSGVSCPSTSLCVAVDRVGNVITSSNPTGGASTWTTTNVDGTDRNVSWLEGVSCPTDNLCVAVDGGSNVLTSTDPTGGAAAWKVTHVDEGGINLGLPVTMTAVSCSRTDLCVAVDSRGNIVTSINPAGGAAQWSITKLDPYSMSAVSCVTSGLCVVVDNSGRIFTSTNPTGGAAAWKVASVDINQGMGFFLGVSCAGDTLCLAIAEGLYTVASTTPTGGTAAWSVTQFGQSVNGATCPNVNCPHLGAVSCPSRDLCVAVGSDGILATSSHPAAGVTAWTPSQVDGSNTMEAVSCPSSSFCAAVDNAGYVVIGTSQR